MFCRLYELKVLTGIDLSAENEVCIDSCPYCKDSGVCSISEEVNIPLSKEKFGWRISNKIAFEEPIPSKNGNTFYCNFIRLIHPIFSDIWIVRILKKDGETISYLVYYTGKHTDTFKSLESANKILKEKYKLNGRNIKEEDFNVYNS